MYFKTLWYHFQQTQDIQNWAQLNTGRRAPKSEKLDFYSRASSTPLVKPLVCQCSDKWLFIVGQQDWSSFSESWMGNTCYRILQFYRTEVCFSASHFPIWFCLKDFLFHAKWRDVAWKKSKSLHTMKQFCHQATYNSFPCLEVTNLYCLVNCSLD